MVRHFLLGVILASSFLCSACERPGPGAPGSKGSDQAKPAPPDRSAFTIASPEAGKEWSVKPGGRGYLVLDDQGGRVAKLLITPAQVKVRVGGKTVARVKARRTGFKLAVGTETLLTAKVSASKTTLHFADGRKRELTQNKGQSAVMATGAKGLSPNARVYLDLEGLTVLQRLVMAVWVDEGATGRR